MKTEWRNLDDDPMYFHRTKAQYLGEDNEAFDKNGIYIGNFLVFENVTIVHCFTGSRIANNHTWMTKTKYWRMLVDE